MKRWLRKILLGITLPTEYVTARRGDLPVALKTVRTIDEDSSDEILFLGYKKPLIGLITTVAAQKNDSYRIHSFQVIDIQSREIVGKIDGHARETISLGNQQLTIVQCGATKQHLELEIHQTNDWFVSIFRKKNPGNIELTKWEFDFLKLQYGSPREIRIAVVSDGEKYNLFPIDLFGFVDDYMILSLRHQMKSCSQLEAAKRMATWIVEAVQAPVVYAMGKFHGMDLQSARHFELSEDKSPAFGFPAPKGSMACEEFELVRQIEPDYGHHRLFILKRVGNKAQPDENSLVHIHRAYAEWLLKQGFSLKQISR